MNEESVPQFGGRPGEPVPEVNPEDVKTVWAMQSEAQKRHGGITRRVFEHVLPAGTDIDAVCYRARQLGLVNLILNDDLAQKHLPASWHRVTRVDDVVFRATAKIPMEWIGGGVRQGLPFDINEFLRLCGE